jgi:O-antigen/teichoic acid export membrane protein
MSQAARIRRNSLFSFLSISLRLIANVLVFWIIARFYGPEVFGQFTLAHTIATIFILFADFGFDFLLTTEIARNREEATKLFQQYFSLKLIFSSAAFIGMWLIGLFGNLSSTARILVFLFSLYMVFTTLTNFLYALFKGFESMQYETKVSFVVNISLICVVLLLVALKSNIILITTVFIITRVIGFVIGIYYSFKVNPNITFQPHYANWKEVKEKVLVFGFHLFFSYLFFQMDTVLIAFFRSDYEVGIYQSVFKLIMLPLVIPEILMNALLPVLSRLNRQDQFQWKRVGYLMNKILVSIGLPISILLLIYSDQIIHIVYGRNQYAESIPVLKIFAIILFLRFTLETFALMLTTSNRHKVRLNVVIVASSINLILNIIFIPIYGVLGAAIVALITNSFVALAFYFFTLPLFIDWMANLRFVLLSIISAMLFYLLWINRTITVFVGAPIFLAIIFIFLYFYFFTKEERQLFFSTDYNFSFFKKMQ